MATSEKDNGKTEAGKAEARTYIVLQQHDNEDGPTTWSSVGRSNTTTPKQAIAAIVDTLPGEDRDGTFVAVPARNWSPLTRRTETVVKASWS